MFLWQIPRNGYLFSENYPWKYGPYQFWAGLHQYTTDQIKSEYPLPSGSIIGNHLYIWNRFGRISLLKMEEGKDTKWGELFSKTSEMCFSLPKWEFSTGKKHLRREKIKKNDFAPSENYSSFAPAIMQCVCVFGPAFKARTRINFVHSKWGHFDKARSKF